MPTPPPRFADRLHTAIERAGSPVCVGLDPVLESLPAVVRAKHHEPLAAIEEFGLGVIDAVAGVAAAVKFQSACYERYGGAGVSLLERQAHQAAERGLVVILDAKRGDIGISASHYAAAAKRSGSHAITVNGYLGLGTVRPYLEAGLGVFVLVRTSNPESDSIQSQRLVDGRSVGELMGAEVAALGAGCVGQCGLSDVGAVVGATKAHDARALRERMPDQVFLIPGYGAQGGTAEDIRGMLRAKRAGAADAGVLVTASRSIIYAFERDATDWAEQVRGAAVTLRSEIAAIVRL
jgi:orotidine-5'-phosphate decarboxylase